jgi:hypothetical protein
MRPKLKLVLKHKLVLNLRPKRPPQSLLLLINNFLMYDLANPITHLSDVVDCISHIVQIQHHRLLHPLDAELHARDSFE